MNPYEGRTALVTGAASGIGLALSQGLVARGARVWMTDVDGEAVARAAASVGAAAEAETLDVRDATAVSDLVGRIDEAHGLDLLFNNAGIGVACESHSTDVEHYDRVLDVNVRGVTNGVAAAYPRMVARGTGHIVNTASAAGLVPVPLMAAYAMSKHAVVGLGESLRLEGEIHGVRVSTLCPTAIETSLIDAEGPSDLPRPWRPDLRRYLTRVGGPPRPVADFAETALDGVARNRGLIVWPARARLAVWANRLAPPLARWVGRRALRAELEARPSA